MCNERSSQLGKVDTPFHHMAEQTDPQHDSVVGRTPRRMKGGGGFKGLVILDLTLSSNSASTQDATAELRCPEIVGSGRTTRIKQQLILVQVRLTVQ